MDAFGGPIHGEETRRYDEFACLNLTVTAPAMLLDPNCETKVAVMVYVHGGGFVEGAHHGGPHDMTRMVTMSCLQGRPVVIVSINYRLHYLGLLACQDLMDEAILNNEPPCNFALYDQRLAFLWVQKYISGFGGNEKRVTAFGESAGCASLCFHLSSTIPLFNRVILQSGSAATISATPCPSKNEEYLKLLEFCDIDKSDPQRLERLRNVPVETLVEAAHTLTNSAFSPLAHESFFTTTPTYSNHHRIVAECPWIEEVILGDAVYEGYLFASALQSIQYHDFRTHVHNTLGKERGNRLLQVYEIHADIDANLFWTRLCVFTGDIMFSLPIHHLAQSLSKSGKPTYRYSLSLRNPFPGSPYSFVLGHHFIELAYQFMTLLDRFPLPVQRDVSVGFAARWLAFANGDAPWSPYACGHTDDNANADEALAVADEREGWVVRSRLEDSTETRGADGGVRRYLQWEAMSDIFESLGEGADAAVASLAFPSLMGLVRT